MKALRSRIFRPPRVDDLRRVGAAEIILLTVRSILIGIQSRMFGKWSPPNYSMESCQALSHIRWTRNSSFNPPC